MSVAKIIETAGRVDKRRSCLILGCDLSTGFSVLQAPVFVYSTPVHRQSFAPPAAGMIPPLPWPNLSPPHTEKPFCFDVANVGDESIIMLSGENIENRYVELGERL